MLLPLHVFRSSGARSAASRSRPSVPGVTARTVRHGLHVQVSVPGVTARARATASTFSWRFPVLGDVDLPGPVPVVNVTSTWASFLFSYGAGQPCSRPSWTRLTLRPLSGLVPWYKRPIALLQQQRCECLNSTRETLARPVLRREVELPRDSLTQQCLEGRPLPQHTPQGRRRRGERRLVRASGLCGISD